MIFTSTKEPTERPVHFETVVDDDGEIEFNVGGDTLFWVTNEGMIRRVCCFHEDLADLENLGFTFDKDEDGDGYISVVGMVKAE